MFFFSKRENRRLKISAQLHTSAIFLKIEVRWVDKNLLVSRPCKNNGFTLVSPALFLYLNHPTKIDVTSGQIGAQQPVSAKSSDGVRVRHDFFGFLSHQYQELWTVDMKNVVKILLRLHEQGFSKEVFFFYCFYGKYETAKRRVMEKISHSQNEWRSDFWLLWVLIVRKLKL